MSTDTTRESPAETADASSSTKGVTADAKAGGSAGTRFKQNPAMAANSPPGGFKTSSEDLLEQARIEAVTAIKAMDRKEMQAEQAGYVLFQIMYRLGHTFINNGEWNNAAFAGFCEQNKLKKHGNAKSNWQLVAKMCFPNKTRSDRVTKFGQALAAMEGAGIPEDGVLIALQAKAEPDSKDMARRHEGMYRYVLLFRLRKAQEARKAQGGKGAQPLNRFATMAIDKLRVQANLLLEALKTKGVPADAINQVTVGLDLIK